MAKIEAGMAKAGAGEKNRAESLEAALRELLLPERVVETHAALVFLTETRAYKLKKSIVSRHFDHRTSEARYKTCMAEVAVNQALAPNVYLGVWPITRIRDHGIALRGEGDPIDWLIVMQRLPDDALLDHVTSSGAPIPWEALDAVMDRLVRFYRQSRAPEIARGKYLETLRDETRLNFDHLTRWKDTLGDEVGPLCRKALTRLDEFSSEITQREREGQVVDGHGDLRPEHICLNPPVIFDRMEFSARHRLIDVHDEIGYLGLEAEILGNREIGRRLFDRLAKDGFPPPSRGLLSTYRMVRSLIRARLCIDHLLDAHPRTPDVWPEKARTYLAHAKTAGQGMTC
ncbi:MAG: hypothetical protein QNJ20_03520 [Paracoccaceae bacterium]|nr:hypothetical protein [Paracoccaceae bacterium]